MRSDRRSRRSAAPAASEGLELLVVPQTDSRRPFRWALVGAVVVHAALLLSPLRYTVEAAPEPEPPKVFVVQQTRFKPPPIDPVPEIPRPRARRVPVPDPDPHDPEPIRSVRDLPVSLDLPVADPAFAIPDAPPPPPQEGPLRIGGPVSRPVKTAGPIPVYPEAARRAHFECTVMLQTVIDAQGRVTDIEPRKECPLGMTEAAIRAVQRWRYEPALRKGLPVAVFMELRVDFSLR